MSDRQVDPSPEQDPGGEKQPLLFGSKLPSSTFKPTLEIIDAIKDLAPVYKALGLPGFLTVSGVVIGIFTIVLSFLTGTDDQGQWYGGIDFWEEFLFMAIAVVFVAIGSLLLLRNNASRAAIQEWTIKLERERNKWIHEETMAQFEIPGSRSPSPGTVRATTSSENQDPIKDQ